MNSTFKNNQGQAGISELLLGILLLFAFCLICVLGYKAFGEINTAIQTDTTLSNTTKEFSNDFYNRYDETFDFFAPMILVLLWFVGLVIAYFSEGSPAFMIFGVLLLVIIALIGGFLGNTFVEVADDPEIDIASAFPYTYFVFDNFMLISIVLIGSVLLLGFVRGSY